NASLAPEVKMPDLKDASLKQATMILESYSMKVGKLIYLPDLAKNVVLDQQFEGKPIAPGAAIRKGSVIDLVLGDGSGITEVEVPNLVGMSLREAKFVLEGSSLVLRAVVYDNYVKEDSLDAIVYQQAPDPNDGAVGTLNAGDGVDVFVTSPDHYDEKNPE
ncbi:MAG TPA: PASTA domain-containing protein, partial [Chitinophagales bacterium]|nr:PASTA domain-containing protein [Chitinophagales bacterium]